MTKRISIRAKLALALLVPVLAMSVVSIYEVDQANTEVDRVRADTDLAAAALGPGSLIRVLQDERNDSAVSAVGLRESANLPTEDLAETREVVDAAAAEFRAELASAGPRAEQVYASALEAFDRTTEELRARYDEAIQETDPGLGQLPLSNEMWDGYSESIERFIEANTRLTLFIDDPELRSAAEMLDAVSRHVEYLGVMVRTAIFSSLGGDDVEGTMVADVIAAVDRFEANGERITLLATGSYAADARGLAGNVAYQDTVALVEGYVDTGELDTAGVISAVSERPTPNLDTVARATTSALQDRSATLRSDAETRRRNFVALAAFVLVAGGALLVLAARSITRPLLSLTRQAEDMATDKLPSAVQQILDTPLGEDVVIPDVAPVRVKTRDEVREVATALTSVQRSALDLAVEQAVLRRNIADSFVNLGRRTQNLIGRQLDFITELERNETDPAALDNLFKLDHLATRARRNAESLVVLAGLVTPRTWTGPIAMGDVVRAALSEVEDYQRVEVRGIGDATVPGRTASDLVHLLAELVENGLSFSPPGRPVEIHGRMTRNGYVLAVIDQGIGMTEEEVAVANERLAGRESYTVAPSRYLGHYVAGSLAQRIGVAVSLAESPTGGITAKVNIPGHVLEVVPALGHQPAPALATGAPAAPAAAPEPALTPASADRADPVPAEGRDGAVATSGRVGAASTTTNGLRKRVRAGSTATPTPTSTPTPASAAAPAAAPADPAPAPAAAPVLPREPVPVVAPPADPVPALAATPTGVVDPTATERPRSALWEPPASPPAPDRRAAPAAATTANGLRKRVPGDQLAANPLAPTIRRGTGLTVPDGATPAPDSAAADSMFSLLSSFESGVARGRVEYSQLVAGPEAAAPDEDPEAPDREV